MRSYPQEGSVPHECIFDAKAEWIPFGEIGIFPPPLLTGILKKFRSIYLPQPRR